MDSTRRRARALATLVSAAIVASSCGGSAPDDAVQPIGSGSAASSAADASAALATLAQSDDIVIENTMPELLGFDPPEAPPIELAMGDDISSATSLDPTDGETSQDPAAADAPETESSTDSPEPVEVVLPDPPPAAPGNDALYDDPTTSFVAASGRPAIVVSPTDGATTRGVTDQEIHVGAVVASTVAGLPLREQACLGAEARYRQAEFHDELTRAIVFDGCLDDAAQAELSEGVARSLVDGGAFALAPVASPAFLAEAFLDDERVPYVGDESLPAFCGRHVPFGFGTGGARGCPVLDARGYAVLTQPVMVALARAFDDQLPADIMVVADAGPQGAAILASRQLEAELASLPIPVPGPALPDAGDGPPATWGPIAAAIIEADPDMVIIEGAVTEGLPTALHRRGYAGEVVLVGAVDPIDIADDRVRATLGRLTVVSPSIDVADRTSRGWQSLAGAAAAVGVQPDEIGLDFVQGYVAADLLIRGIAATPEPLTAERLVHTMNDGWWYPGIEGLACGSWWPASRYAPTPCVSVARVDPASPVLVPLVDLVETEPQLRFLID